VILTKGDDMNLFAFEMMSCEGFACMGLGMFAWLLYSVVHVAKSAVNAAGKVLESDTAKDVASEVGTNALTNWISSWFE
jgi:hypothetical protein